MAEPLDDQIAAATAWEKLLDRIREVEGLEDFLKPPRLDDLRPTVEGPVVMVNVGRARCDALVVSATDVLPVPLPGLTTASLRRTAGDYLTAVHVVEAARAQLFELHRRLVEGDPDPEVFGAYEDLRFELTERIEPALEKTLRHTLGWLWDVVAEPVLTALDLQPHHGPGAPRIWWCPSGLLTLLPLHAAGHHDQPGRSVLDRVVSSYTPSLRVLRRASRPRARDDGGGPGRMLVVTLPHTPGQAPLPNSAAERRLLEELFEIDRRTVLEDSAATRDRVRTELRTHRYIHLSCHGTQDLANPSLARVLLADGPLSVADLVADGFEAEFAFLSACKTATGGVSLPDEVITLASAVHHLGARHVIATLWSVSDPAAGFVADRLYRKLTEDGDFDPDGAARALHAAVLDLRDRHRDRPGIWLPFTHTGP
ncbi:CHAT domain-containing protein [Kitasatospora terrestris]